MGDIAASPRHRVPASLFRLGETPRQAGMLFSAHIGSMVTALAASLLLARELGLEIGRFFFCQGFVVVAGLFFEFGIFSAGARVLALAEDRESERQALGALLALAAILGLAFSLFILAASVPVDYIFKQDVRWLLIGAAPFAFFHPFQLFIEQSCQGLNQIRRLSLFQLLMTGSYMLALIALALAHRLTAATALSAYLIGIGVASFWTLARLRPSFKNTSLYIRLTFKEVRGYGLNLYMARITGTAMTRLDSLVIPYYLGRAGAGLDAFGLYGMAQRLSNPITTMSRSLAITRFRAFAKLSQVPGRINRWNIIVLLMAATGLLIVGPYVLKLLRPEFAGAVPLLLPFALYNIFTGLFQPYNMFLSSHGRGAELRNIAALVAIAGFTGLVLTVPYFGVTGAAWAGAVTMALDYLLHLYYYRRFMRTLKHAGERGDAERMKAEG
ncbi:MAG: polysaccharide biosynthesis C-terminal domain-containing protein [Blastocatellia bacterium]|nr:polysaccharide biosynthesis C-terminal domain-containing protein [Blastocatellia bacterium]